MQQRSALVRFLAMGFAALQFASPAVSAVADGRLAAANASGPATHVEATTTASCPVVHSPDCAICRYLSGPAAVTQLSPPSVLRSAEGREPGAEQCREHDSARRLPQGRAPPAI